MELLPVDESNYELAMNMEGLCDVDRLLCCVEDDELARFVRLEHCPRRDHRN